MSHDVDDEIRADFLTEAGELVQRLGEQLVELESRPDDAGLLNDIFRAFHTVKGGAGFLDVGALVEICHAAEDVFNRLRAGELTLSAPVLDAVLQAVDVVQSMMHAIAVSSSVDAAPAALLSRLHNIAAGQLDVAAPVAAVALEPAAPVAEAAPKTPAKRSRRKKATAVPNEAAAASTPASSSGDTISDDEFEALLDQLHGKGGIPGSASAESPAAPPAPVTKAPIPATPLTAPLTTAPPPPAAAAAPPAETTVRVDIARLDKMMNLVGELVLVRNRLKDLRSRNATAADIARAVGELDFITRSLQSSVMQIRMQPIRKVFSRFPKIARDVARGLGKQVEVVLEGEDTDLDKNLVEALADPLVHMVRNSVDHGIEMPEERRRRGKPEAGSLTLSARQEGDHILIRMADDGAGIDAERVRSKAIEKGLLGAAEAAALSPEECLQLVFMAGFSTRDTVSDLSGRGVGMDVVMSRIKSLNGNVRIESRVGFGTTVHIRVPLTLAILSALMVHADNRQFALPLAPVQDVFELTPERVSKLDRWDVVLTRNDTLRLVYLDPWLDVSVVDEPTVSTPHHVVVAQVGEHRYGFVVREVLGREEIVIKPLGKALRGIAGVAAATVLPDGRVSMILDFPGLVEAYRRRLHADREVPTPIADKEEAHG